MKKPYLYVDFNEMVEADLVLLSQHNVKKDVDGDLITLIEGLSITVFMDDIDSVGNKEYLIAEGIVEENTNNDWSSHVRWCCRINERGIRSKKSLKE